MHATELASVAVFGALGEADDDGGRAALGGGGGDRLELRRNRAVEQAVSATSARS